MKIKNVYGNRLTFCGVQPNPRLTVQRMPQLQHWHNYRFRLEHVVEIVEPEFVEPLQIADPDFLNWEVESSLSALSSLSSLSSLSEEDLQSGMMDIGLSENPYIECENPLYAAGLDFEIGKRQVVNLGLQHSLKKMEGLLKEVHDFNHCNKEISCLGSLHIEMRLVETEIFQRIAFDETLLELKQKFLKPQYINPFKSSIKGDSGRVLVIHSGGGLRPPKGPPNDGFGGDGDGFGGDGDGFGNNLNPFHYLVLSALFLLMSYFLYEIGMKGVEKALADLQTQLNDWLAKDPKNPRKRLYALFLKSLAMFIALFATPAAFNRAVAVLGHPLLIDLLRALRFIARLALVLSLFLGSSLYFLDFYKFLMSYLSPILNRTINLLAGPHHISLSVLFLEKLFKVQVSSILCSVSILYFQSLKAHRSKRLLNCVCLVGCCIALYVVLLDFTHLRKLALICSHHPIVNKLLGSQTGRLLLLMGSVSLLKYIGNFPGISVFYTVLVYALGVFSLVFSASANVLPIP